MFLNKRVFPQVCLNSLNLPEYENEKSEEKKEGANTLKCFEHHLNLPLEYGHETKQLQNSQQPKSPQHRYAWGFIIFGQFNNTYNHNESIKQIGAVLDVAIESKCHKFDQHFKQKNTSKKIIAIIHNRCE